MEDSMRDYVKRLTKDQKCEAKKVLLSQKHYRFSPQSWQLQFSRLPVPKAVLWIREQNITVQILNKWVFSNNLIFTQTNPQLSELSTLKNINRVQ